MRKIDAVLDVHGWVAVSPEEQVRIMDRLATRPERPAARRRSAKKNIERPSDVPISPLDLYVYLKARFGPPNDLMMATRTQGTDNLIQWGYYLRAHKHDFRIHGTSNRLEIFARMPRQQWSALIDAVKADFSKHGKAMTAIRRELERWSLFINPFRRVANTVASLAAQLEAIELNEPPSRSMFMTRSEADTHNAARDRWTRDAFVASMLSTSIRMLAPVVAEAFVNFVLFALGRPDVRQDTRVYDAAIRQPIDVRVRSLHLYCDGVLRPIETAHEAFTTFQTLMNRRNDFLHGNIDPTRLAFDDVFFDSFYGGQVIPLFKDDRGVIARYVANSFRFAEPAAALEDVNAVQAFVDHVLTHLTDDVRLRLMRLLSSEFLGRNVRTGDVAELFAHPAVESLLIVSDEEEMPKKSKCRPTSR